MSEYGLVTEPRTVRFERVLPGPIERVWAYLTESEKRRKWLASGEMELRVGGRVELKFNHADLSADIEPTPRGIDVMLVLTERRLRDHAEMVSVASGWHTHLGILVDRLNDCEPRLDWSTRAQVEAEYEKRLPAD